MKRCILGLLLFLMVTAGAEPSPEQIAGNRLREILGTRAIQKNTRYGGMLTMIDVPEDSRNNVHYEFFRLLKSLRSLGTRDSVRVMADLLDDDRYVLEPGDATHAGAVEGGKITGDDNLAIDLQRDGANGGVGPFPGVKRQIDRAI